MASGKRKPTPIAPAISQWELKFVDDMRELYSKMVIDLHHRVAGGERVEKGPLSLPQIEGPLPQTEATPLRKHSAVRSK